MSGPGLCCISVCCAVTSSALFFSQAPLTFIPFFNDGNFHCWALRDASRARRLQPIDFHIISASSTSGDEFLKISTKLHVILLRHNVRRLKYTSSRSSSFTITCACCEAASYVYSYFTVWVVREANNICKHTGTCRQTVTFINWRLTEAFAWIQLSSMYNFDYCYYTPDVNRCSWWESI